MATFQVRLAVDPAVGQQQNINFVPDNGSPTNSIPDMLLGTGPVTFTGITGSGKLALNYLAGPGSADFKDAKLSPSFTPRDDSIYTWDYTANTISEQVGQPFSQDANQWTEWIKANPMKAGLIGAGAFLAAKFLVGRRGIL